MTSIPITRHRRIDELIPWGDSAMTNGSLDALVQWFAAHCNGEWEHTHGIELNTLDNPGWILRVDVVDTELEHIPFSATEHQREDSISWWRCWRDDVAFHAACGVKDLDAVLDVFVAWADANRSRA